MNWRTVGGAFGIQAAVAAFVLWVPWGKTFLNWLTNGVQAVIDCGQVGIAFLFGMEAGEKSGNLGFVFAFHVLPVIIFFSAFIAVLYYLRVMQVVISLAGGVLKKVLGTSRAESFSAAANIFVGQTEAPLVVKPYLMGMTRSELFAVMTGGLASVAGSVLVGYNSMGAEMKYLLAACFMAAPAGLLYAKLLMPETEVPKDQAMEIAEEEKPVNVFDAAAQGAGAGMKLALNVGRCCWPLSG